MKIATYLTSLAACYASIGTASSPAHVKRQSSCKEIEYYYNLVVTALFTVNYIKTFNPSCSPDLIPSFNARGMDGIYALDIICLWTSGSNLFGGLSLNLVNDELIVAWLGLFDALHNSNDPSRTLSCVNLDTTLLDELALPSDKIKKAICEIGDCTIDGNNTTSSSSISSSTMPSSSAGTSSLISSSASRCSHSSSFSITGSSSKSEPPVYSSAGYYKLR